MRTANPTLTDNTFSNLEYASATNVMTVQGVVFKTVILLLLTMLTAGWSWLQLAKGGAFAASASTWLMVGAIGGFALAIVTTFKPAWSAITAPLYAIVEGLFIGILSAIFEQTYNGIVMQAVLLTFGTLTAMLAAYQTGLIRATETFKSCIIAATGGIAIAYLLAFVLSFFNIQIPLIFGNGWVGILFSVAVIIIAALNFILDFDFIEQGAQKGAPKYMEWYGGFALMVTLIWLYIEFLRLLSKLRSRE